MAFAVVIALALAAADAAPPALVSDITQRPEHVGQCFETRFHQIGSRLSSEVDGRTVYQPESGSAASFDDGHIVVGYERLPAIEQSRPGDPARLCVVELPEMCPPGDHRGIVYRGVNRRTGLSFTLADFPHACGGA